MGLSLLVIIEWIDLIFEQHGFQMLEISCFGVFLKLEVLFKESSDIATLLDEFLKLKQKIPQVDEL